MKLIFAIVNNDDAHAVSSSLTKNGFITTKLASTGGFLMSGNTTFMACCENNKVDDVIEIIKANSRKRTQLYSAPQGDIRDSYTSFPTEVCVGGATVFVTDIERFEKL